MGVVIKFLHIVALYALLFFVAMIVVVTWLVSWSPGAQMGFAFGAPALAVWWNERRLPAGASTTVAGRDLGGMIYVGTPPSLNSYGYRDKCRAYIDPSLSVASVAGDREGRGMPYWPGYSDIGPQYRATYLDWLAKGRSDPSYDPGFMFLYFYGLERRFFVDQSNAEAARQSLGAHVDAIAGLSDVERRRLRANLDWFLSVPPDLGRRVKDFGPEHHAASRAALVSATLADGIIAAEEVAGIEKVYKALGIDPGLAYSDLHAGDLPAMVRAARPTARGEAIPPEQAPTGPVLDAALIAAIRSDTERVSSVLGEIFVDAEEPGDAPVAPGSTVLKGLDDKHAALVRDLVGRGHWTEEDFDRLCADRKLLSAGALEAINEWAYETYDEALLDEYDGYDVAPDIAAALTNEFEREGQYVQFEAT